MKINQPLATYQDSGLGDNFDFLTGLLLQIPRCCQVCRKEWSWHARTAARGPHRWLSPTGVSLGNISPVPQLGLSNAYVGWQIWGGQFKKKANSTNKQLLSHLRECGQPLTRLIVDTLGAICLVHKPYSMETIPTLPANHMGRAQNVCITFWLSSLSWLSQR